MENNNPDKELYNPALAQVRRTERKVAVPSVVSSSSEKKDISRLLVNFIIFIGISGLLFSVAGGIIAITTSSASSKNGGSADSETLAKAKQAESYVPEITKEQEEFAKKAGGDSTLDMFKKTNSGKVKMEADPDAGLKNNAAGENGSSSDGSDDSSGSGSFLAQNQSGILANAKSSLGGSGFGSNGGSKAKPKLNPTFASFANNNFRPMHNAEKMPASGKNLNGGINSKNKFASRYNSFKQPKLGKDGKLVASSKSLRQAEKRPANKIGSRGGRNTWQQAKAMNSMIRSAVTAEHFSTAKAEMDVAWEGTTGDSEAENILETSGLEEGEGMVVNPGESGSKQPGGTPSYKPNNPNFTPDIPDVSDILDVTPWKKELDAITYLFMGAMALLGVAAMIADTQYGKPIAIGMAATATAACAAGVGLAITIMSKYKQAELGGMWLGICGAGLAACAVAAVAGIAAYKGAETGVMGFLAAHIKAILLIMALAGGIGSAVAGSQGADLADKDKAKQYCKDHPDDSTCKSQLEEYKKKYNVSMLGTDLFENVSAVNDKA